MRSGNPPTSGVDHTLYGRLTLAGPEVRIHLPPAVSHERTVSRAAARCSRAPVEQICLDHLGGRIPAW